MVDIYLVFLHQKLNPIYVLGDHLVFTGNHLRKVDCKALHVDAMRSKSMGRIVVVLRGVQQGLGWNTAHIQAGAAKGGIFFYQGCFHP